MTTDIEPRSAAKRVTKRRGETRQRLLDAAFEVFAEEGFGRSTVEQICERAGFTRGAFYSNFEALDELFLAMWEQRSTRLVADVEAILAQEDLNELGDVRDVVERLLGAVPVDDGWYRITAEFTAHALRNPALRQVMAGREDVIVATLTPILTDLLDRAGRTVPDRLALGQALVAVHDGTSIQCLLEPDNPAVRARRVDLFTHVVIAYSTRIEG
ncbi:TetR/AcrR family transcriptional regulator [Antrihabitans sp. YC3-6]|uniref:TetR/AcrR family transcriptional regulator n=1 Tax=Antrihabitans stalagmiti TaxID=2799499 RepID=A0A934NMI6_9NOCA|nr:TetR/AcrR family transcriptional regulator [Antrihabitans stalagmiti]MBJ8337867.1 TetR/AcrR family transcriptional regulator [Antrihabitans stalagmiti]